jgi:hypothetical protein
MTATQTMNKHNAARLLSYGHLNGVSVNCLLNDHFAILWLIEEIEAGRQRHDLGNGWRTEAISL